MNRTLGTPWESRFKGFEKDRSKLSLCKAPENDRRTPGSGTWKDRSKSKGPELSHRTKVREIVNDTQTNMLTGYPMSAICVQRFDDSLNSAIHITYRNWLRSSSMHEKLSQTTGKQSAWTINAHQVVEKYTAKSAKRGRSSTRESRLNNDRQSLKNLKTQPQEASFKAQN